MNPKCRNNIPMCIVVNPELYLQKLHITPTVEKSSREEGPPENMSATAKLITKYVDRLQRLWSLQNAITIKEFSAIMATDSVRWRNHLRSLFLFQIIEKY